MASAAARCDSTGLRRGAEVAEQDSISSGAGLLLCEACSAQKRMMRCQHAAHARDEQQCFTAQYQLTSTAGA